jgi:hypothetical protein
MVGIANGGFPSNATLVLASRFVGEILYIIPYFLFLIQIRSPVHPPPYK